MELVLTLIRNLLRIQDCPSTALKSCDDSSQHLQADLIVLLHQENVFNVFVLIAQDIESPETKDWNLLLLEIFALAVQCANPEVVGNIKECETTKSLHTRKAISGGSALKSILDTEKTAAASITKNATRHSNFGGHFKLMRTNGKSTLLSTLHAKPQPVCILSFFIA